LDDLTGRIAKQLYQNAAIDIIGFQDRKLPKNYYDLAISNVPFGTIRYQYGKQNFNIHNFFFAKAMDAVRPGGIVAFITGQGTMQSGKDAAVLRAMLNGQADLIAAFKLPSQTFDKNAGTQVTSDILILQKHLDKNKPSEHAQNWMDIKSIDLEVKRGDYRYMTPLDINSYFQNNPQNMIGKPVVDKLQAGERLGLDSEGRDVAKELSALMENLPQDIYKPVEGRKPGVINIAQKYYDSKTPTYTFMLRDGKLYQQRIFEVVEVPKENQQKVQDYLRLVKAVENLLNEQISNPKDDKLPQLRQTLSDAYDNFVKNNGYINAAENINVLGADSRFGMTAAIEDYKEEKVGDGKKKQIISTAKKGDIFFKRTLGAVVEPTTAKDINDALSVSIAWHGDLDIDYMSKLLGKTPAQVISELGDNIFENPVTKLYELAEEYLSGNVREKLAIAEEAAKTNPKYKRNVDALRDTKVQPTDLNENQIAANIGATWIDVSYYNQFLNHILLENPTYTISLNRNIGKWQVAYNYRYNSTTEARNSTTWGVEKVIAFTDIMERLLNSKSLEITYKEEYYEDGKKKTRTLVDKEKTALVKQKAKEIQAEFE
ncbi:MAG: hypothetical protein IJS81_02055, partial [Selenomonadaceae bacterium]|nr:hypothetical protein [Selenomonadaceae bacterium]